LQELTLSSEKNQQEYLSETWGKIFASLNDKSKIEYDTKKTTELTKHSKKEIKSKFLNFFNHLQEQWKIQKGYNIPDLELRELMRELTISSVMENYTPFHLQYSVIDLDTTSKLITNITNIGKESNDRINNSSYVLYDISVIPDMLSQFFSNDE
jgi:phosphatidylserine/phosphatidylglycerophosphate/cardiolipin synthase-like enzyme